MTHSRDSQVLNFKCVLQLCGYILGLIKSDLIYRGGLCCEVVFVVRWSLLRGGLCCEVVSVERWSLL